MAYATDLTKVVSILAAWGIDASSIPATGSGASLEDLQDEAYHDVRGRLGDNGVDPDGLTASATLIAARLENLLTAEQAMMSGQFPRSREATTFFRQRISSAMKSLSGAVKAAGSTHVDVNRMVGTGSMVSNADNFWPETTS